MNVKVLATLASVGMFAVTASCASMQAAYEQEAANRQAQQAQQAAQRQMAVPTATTTPYGTVSCGMTAAAFDALAESVESQIGSDAYQTASIAVRTNPMTAYQIKLLLGYLDFDSDRVKLVNDACLNLCDPQNLYQIFDAITFSSNKEQLANCRNLYVAPTADDFANQQQMNVSGAVSVPSADSVYAVSPMQMDPYISSLEAQADSPEERAALMGYRATMGMGTQIQNTSHAMAQQAAPGVFRNGGSVQVQASAGPVTVLTPLGPSACGMSVDEFNTLAQSVKSKMGTEAYRSASLAVRTNAMTTEQVKTLMGYLSFDRDRVKLVNDACLNLCDPKNLYQIYDAVTFNNNKSQLSNCESLYVAPTASEFVNGSR